MRVLSSAAIAIALLLAALTPASAQSEAAAQAEAMPKITIPASMLKFYCFAGPGAYSIGAVVCLSRNQWGTCKWTNQGSNHSAPANSAYWMASMAPFGSCP